MPPLADAQLSYSTSASSGQHSGNGGVAQLLSTTDNIDNNNGDNVGDNNKHSRKFNATVPTKLRRAEYVRVVDLVPDIDMSKLKAELARIEREEAEGRSSSSSTQQESEQQSSSVEGSVEVRGNYIYDKSSGKGGSCKISNVKPYAQKVVPATGGFNLCLLVGKINVVVDKIRVDKSRVRLAEVEVGDETGTVSLRARDEQIDLLTSSHGERAAVVLRNCTLELFQGKHLRVAITKWGKISIYPDQVESTPHPPKRRETEVNFSKVDLSKVMPDEPVPARCSVDKPIFPVARRGSASSLVGRQQLHHSHKNSYQYYEDLSLSSGGHSANMNPPHFGGNRQQKQYPKEGSHDEHYYVVPNLSNESPVPKSAPAPSYMGVQPVALASPGQGMVTQYPSVFSGMAPFPSMYGDCGSSSSGGVGGVGSQQHVYGYDQLEAAGQRQHLTHQPSVMISDQQQQHAGHQKHQLIMYQQMLQQQYEQMQLYQQQQQQHSFSHPDNSMIPQSQQQGSSGMGIFNAGTGMAGHDFSSMADQFHSPFQPVINEDNTNPINLSTQQHQQQQLNFGLKDAEKNSQQVDGYGIGGEGLMAITPSRKDYDLGSDFHSPISHFEGQDTSTMPQHQVQHLYMTDAWSGVPSFDVPASPPINTKAASFTPYTQRAAMPHHTSQDQQQQPFFLHPQHHQQMSPYPYVTNAMDGTTGEYKWNYHQAQNIAYPNDSNKKQRESQKIEDEDRRSTKK